LRRILGYLVSFVVVCGMAQAQEAKAPAHRLVTPSEITWGAPPPVFEKEASFAVISGDPGKPGLFVVRLKLPAGYKIAPHWHPTDEQVTVLSGTLALGMGEKFDKGRMTDLPAGGYALLPADMRHFAMATTAATIQVQGEGPFVLTYVNPANDPSKRVPAK
jgi:quercetin dioxygenase-like cupin family protein